MHNYALCNLEQNTGPLSSIRSWPRPSLIWAVHKCDGLWELHTRRLITGSFVLRGDTSEGKDSFWKTKNKVKNMKDKVEVCQSMCQTKVIRQKRNWRTIESQEWSEGLPWWRSGWESACQCRGHGFEPWSGRIPHAAEQLGPWATITEPVRLEPVLRNKRGHDNERPAHCNEEWPSLAATRGSPRTETKTQHSHKLNK